MPPSLECCLALVLVLVLVLVVVLLLSIPLAASLPLSLRRDRWASGFADVLTVGERDGALAVFVLSPTVGEWHCVARCFRCLSTPTIAVVRSLPPSRSLPSGLLLPVLVPALHLCCGLFFSLSLVAYSSLSHSIFSFSL